MTSLSERVLLELDKRPSWKRWARRGVDGLLSNVAPKGPRSIKVLAGPLKGTTLLLDLRSSDRDIWLNTYEPWVQARLRELLGHSRFMWDIGAYIGSYAIMASRLSQGRVLAVEPDPSNAARLRENLRLAGGPDVEVVEAAVGRAEGEAQFATSDSAGSAMTAKVDVAGGRRLKMTTLDALRQQFGDPDLVLMDIEGGEIDALLGASGLVSEVRPTWLIELHGDRGAAAFDHLSSHGYEMETSVGSAHVRERLESQRVHIVARPAEKR